MARNRPTSFIYITQWNVPVVGTSFMLKMFQTGICWQLHLAYVLKTSFKVRKPSHGLGPVCRELYYAVTKSYIEDV